MALKTDRDKCAHLLRRFGLGASEAELDYYLKEGGLSGAVDKLLNYESVPEFDLDIQALNKDDKKLIPMPLLQAYWGLRLVATRRPLEEKMTLFWHDHFATSAQKITASGMMGAQIDILRANATGKFKTLLTEVSKDPAMIFWLDNQFNVKEKPNENFAREVMELFTLGVGNYTEKDIQEAARAFTGWTIQRLRPNQPLVSDKGKLPAIARFTFNRRAHDEGDKSVLGSRGNFDGDDVLGILCGAPRTAIYLTQKIWEWFVYPEPSPKVVERHATKFRDSGLDIKVLIRSIVEDPEFYSAKAERGLYKNPVDFCVASLRQLGVGERAVTSLKALTDKQQPRLGLAPVAAAMQAMKSMGMELLFPPDVSGWESGKAWVTSATMVERIQWADRMFPLATPTGAPRSRKAVFRYPILELIGPGATPTQLVDTLTSVFDIGFDAEKRRAMIESASKFGATITSANAMQAANLTARLIFGSPEFQFC